MVCKTVGRRRPPVGIGLGAEIGLHRAGLLGRDPNRPHFCILEPDIPLSSIDRNKPTLNFLVTMFVTDPIERRGYMSAN